MRQLILHDISFFQSNGLYSIKLCEKKIWFRNIWVSITADLIVNKMWIKKISACRDKIHGKWYAVCEELLTLNTMIMILLPFLLKNDIHVLLVSFRIIVLGFSPFSSIRNKCHNRIWREIITIYHHFIWGQGNPPQCQRFQSTTRLAVS